MGESNVLFFLTWSVILLAMVQILFAWALWSLRKIYISQGECIERCRVFKQELKKCQQLHANNEKEIYLIIENMKTIPTAKDISNLVVKINTVMTKLDNFNSKMVRFTERLDRQLEG